MKLDEITHRVSMDEKKRKVWGLGLRVFLCSDLLESGEIRKETGEE